MRFTPFADGLVYGTFFGAVLMLVTCIFDGRMYQRKAWLDKGLFSVVDWTHVVCVIVWKDVDVRARYDGYLDL